MRSVAKRYLSLGLAIVLCVTMLLGNATEVKAGTYQTPELVNTYQSVASDSPMRKFEYCDMKTDGFLLTVTGRTYKQEETYRVVVRSTKSANYVFRTSLSDGTMTDGHAFSKTLDFSSLDSGDYLAGVRFFSSDDVVGMSTAPSMKYVPLQVTEDGVYIKQFTEIIKHNASIRNADLPQYYKDVYLRDMSHELRNGRTWTKDEVATLTDAQVKALKEISDRETKGAKSDYEKLILLHDYLADHVYYDTPYNKAKIEEKKQMSADGKVTLNPYDLCTQIDAGTQAKTVCNGFAAAYAALLRAQGIPCRTAKGHSSTITTAQWESKTDENLTVMTHVWNEVYINGKWIVVDVNKDCANDYSKDGNGDYVKGYISCYYGIDPSDQSLSLNHFYHGYREEQTFDVNPPVLNNISSKQEPITISWSMVSGAKGYNIYRSDDPSGNYVMIGTSNTTTYKDSTVVKGKKYYYKVTAFDANGMETAMSSWKSVTVMGGSTIPQASITSVASTGTKMEVKWKKLSGITSYEIYRSTSSKGSYQKVGTKTASTSTVTYYDSKSLVYGKTYYYKVRGVKGNDHSALLSGYKSAKYQPAAVNISSISQKNKKVTLKWKKVTNAKKYEVYRSTSASGTYQKVSTTTKLTYTSKTLSKKTYYWKVYAVSSNGTKGKEGKYRSIKVK